MTKNPQLKSAKLYAIVFALGRGSSVELAETGIRFRKHIIKREVAYADITAMPSIKNWHIVRTLRIPTKKGEVVIPGIRSRKALLRFCFLLKKRIHAARLKAVAKFTQQVDDALRDFYEPCLVEHRYLKASMERKWGAKYGDLLRKLESFRKSEFYKKLPTNQSRRVEWLCSIKATPEEYRKAANEQFIATATEAHKEYFDTVESKPLTERQRRACIVDEDNNLVLAGAGSGKTSTIVGKAGFIERMGWADADEILVLAFGNKASRETQERIYERLGSESRIKASTFHSLGLEIIGQATGRKPGLFAMLENSKAYANYISSIRGILVERDSKYREALVTYFSDFLYPIEEPEHFETIGEYYQHMKQHRPVALNGAEVKSLQELRIANFLYRNQVPFRYEADYEVDLATAEYRQYKPDFYIPRNLYIEHYGINSKGETPPFMNNKESQKYKDGIRWKREIHKTHNTGLIETYSWEFEKRVVFEKLTQTLESVKIQLNPMDPKKLLDEINSNDKTIKHFDELITNFLELQKMNNLTLEEIQDLSRADPEKNDWLRSCGFGANAMERFQAFMQIYAPIFKIYSKEIEEAEAVDFSDMINVATQYIEKGRFRSPWKYILVDEFQDISRGRAELIKGLLRSREDSTLFCVGDDWQSIYRFAGADSSYVRKFEERFGASERTDLDMTFRFNSSISSVATTFISKNPFQLKKEIHSISSVNNKRVTLVATVREYEEDGMHYVLNRIEEKVGADERATVFMLGRFKFMEPEEKEMRKLRTRFKKLKISYHTMHASKGMEADYVIVVGLNGGRYGMPCQIQSDPLIELLLPQDEEYENAEERRLLYVAITRSRNHTYLLANYDLPSPFALELLKEQDDYGIEAVDWEGNEIPAKGIVHCDSCHSGVMLQRRRKKDGGLFFGCSNYPMCDHLAPACPNCGEAPLQLKDKKWVCHNCKYTEVACPGCNKGKLIATESPYGPFYRCSNFRGSNKPNSCQHKRNCTPAEIKAFQQELVSS